MPEPLVEGAATSAIQAHKEKSDLYRKANSYAKSMIASAVTDDVYQKIMDKTTAKEAWEALKGQFEATAKDQLFNICDDFFVFNWKEAEDVSTHIAKLKNVWIELNNGLETRNENELPDLILISKILHILPSTFETFRSSWMLLTNNDQKTIDELTTQLCMFERNLKKIEDTEKFSQEALIANSTKQQHEGQSKSTRRVASNDDMCNYCKKRGHWVRECRKWIADGRPSRNKSEVQSNAVDTNCALTSVSSEACEIEVNSVDWWIDNGATRHVTNRPDFFIEFNEFKMPNTIRAAGKEILKALGQGKIEVQSLVNKKIKKVTLTNVWYVPQISKNLFSVLAAQDTKPNSKFVSSATKCWLEIDDETVLCGVRQPNGTLYKALISPVVPKQQIEINVAVANHSMLQLYHERWGHQDKQHIKKMLEREKGIKVKLDKELCEPCIYGKAHRLPFGTREKAGKPGELISGDVCGAFDESFTKKRYLIVFKDSYTKFRFEYIAAEKSEVKDVLKDMIERAKNQGHSIKEFLSDNGGEFDNTQVRKILQKNGITQRLTAPYTPEQNGGTERENRTIVEMARTFKYSNEEVNFPKAIWAELVTTAVYILNRTAKTPIEGVSPYEMWTGKKPRINHLRIIASTCYVHIPVQRRRKMDIKAVKGYLVGYDGNERYRIYLPDQHKVVVSRDVIFQETPMVCEEKVNLPLRDCETEKESPPRELTASKVNKEYNEDKNSAKDESSAQEDISEGEYETGVDTESESESESPSRKSQSSQGRQLRDRSSLRKPKHLDEFVMAAEDFVTETEVPETFQDALQSKQSADWKMAIDHEMKSHEENKTWIKTALPKGAKAIPCRWVFRIKTLPDGTVEKHKARLVVKGFSQRRGVDYSQTFSPVARMGTIRSVLSVAASESMHITQFDVSTAFLYGELDETIYMRQPEGYDDGMDSVCQLKKSLYGLKQAPRCWNRRIGSFLSNLGFKVNEADPCLYVREKNDKKLILVLYVDDGLVAATDQQDLEIFIKELKSEFKIVSKEANYFLGMEITRKRDSIKISQGAYARKILERFNFSQCNPVSTPIVKNSEKSESRKEDGKKHNFPYRQAVGALMYLMLGTRPDLAFSVGFISRVLENPSTEDVTQVKRVFRYIAGTKDLGIVYKCKANKGILECFSDADFGGCTKTGRSTTGVVISHAGGAISWLSQRQGMVTTSTTEAEIVAANEASKEIIWLSRLFRGISSLTQVPVLQVDNSAAVRLAQNPEFHRRTKHISSKHFFIRERIASGQLGIQQISTEKQVSDIMTKPLPKTRLRILCDQMGLA